MSLAVSLDGTDVSGVAIEGSSTRRLNRVSQAQIKIPMDAAIGGAGSKLKISFNGVLHHHGRVLSCETDTGEDEGFTVYNSSDPMELWQWRPVRADDGDFSKPAGDGGANDLFATYITGSEIMQAVLMNTEGSSTAQGNPALTPPSDAEGETFLTFGSFATGGADLSGAPTDWPMTIAEVFTLLASTGEVDLVITPTDPGGGIMGTVEGFNGDYGTDLSGSLVFQYGTGVRNVRRMRWNEDMTSMANKIWYYGGPRIETAADPPGDQHWCWNITGDDPEFDPAGAATLVPPGGRNSPPASATNNQLGVLRIDSQVNDGPLGTGYGVRMDIQIFDALSDLCFGAGSFDPDRWLYRRLWQMESWIRAQPRELIHITPNRGTEIGTFDIGDLVGVEAGAQVRGGFSGAQRVYEYTISWTEDGPFELSELQTSPNGEGI